MNADSAVEMMRNMLIACTIVVGPSLLAALVVGLVVGVLQAATQVNEASIAFVMKLIAMCVVWIALGSWTLRQLVDYTSRAMSSISEVAR
jgi:flagellar biosynthetic protein FliQ